ncbi:MAG: DUF5686 and carboxypeptidase regulatory-like domain-containing protein [Bacteroidales bacterium]|nr:DUF5686 and carboxypeptidase regulatory-like domain-containing protein [Bacteroidales bacterium]
MLRKYLFFCILISTLSAQAQVFEVKGVVKDKKSKEPLAFVNITSRDGYSGVTTDIDGKFSIRMNEGNCCLKLTYVGYETLEYGLRPSNRFQEILMKEKTYELSEVEIFPGENPAHRIINNVVENRDLNNPEKLEYFTYTSYDKMVVTLDADSLLLKDTSLLDTSELKLRTFLKKQDIFLMETVTERKYRAPDLNQETVLATRVSGLKDPVMAFMISQMQSTSFYDELISIAGKNYINPISKGSTKKYFFLIEDTTYTATNDTVFIISFRPMRNTKFDGMKGFLYINSNRWAIQNVKAEPPQDSMGVVIKIQQAYELIQDHWFPAQLNTDIIFTPMQATAGDKSYALVGKGRSYIRDINLSADLKKREFGYHEVEIEPDATKKKGEFWREYRVDSLSERDRETYRVLDSIGKEQNFDKMASTFQTLLIGQIPLWIFNVDLGRIIHYNGYEGLYLGLGLQTNDRFSKTVKLGGFGGYGFKDKSFKYGGDLSVKVHKRSESAIRIEAYKKVTASGGVEFFDDKLQVWKPDNFYKFYLRRMNPTTGGEIAYAFRLRPVRDFKWNLGFRLQNKEAFRDYFFGTADDNLIHGKTEFNYSELMIGFRFAYRERVIETTKGQISFGSKYPVVWFNYTRGIAGFLNGEFAFDRFDLKVEGSKYIKYLGDFSFRLMAGIILGDLPAGNLYDGNGTYRSFALYAPFSFGSMRSNEFLSDKYVSLFLSHDFGKLLFKEGKLFNPQLMLVTNIAFGSLSNTENHHNYDFSTLEKGYYESGFLIRKILDFSIYDLGIGVIYRYGPYGFDNVSKNFAYKISLFYGF